MRRLPGALSSRLAYLVQLVDQLDRLQLERDTSTPSLFVELQLERLQLDRAKSSPSVDFPNPGRAATTIIWPGWSPLVTASRSAKPVGTPSATPPRVAIASISSIVG